MRSTSPCAMEAELGRKLFLADPSRDTSLLFASYAYSMDATNDLIRAMDTLGFDCYMWRAFGMYGAQFELRGNGEVIGRSCDGCDGLPIATTKAALEALDAWEQSRKAGDAANG